MKQRNNLKKNQKQIEIQKIITNGKYAQSQNRKFVKQMMSFGKLKFQCFYCFALFFCFNLFVCFLFSFILF